MADPVPETRARPWIDDPWYDLRPEQAWRAGWEAAKAQAVKALRDSAASWERDGFRDEASAVRMMAVVTYSMAPPA